MLSPVHTVDRKSYLVHEHTGSPGAGRIFFFLEHGAGTPWTCTVIGLKTIFVLDTRWLFWQEEDVQSRHGLSTSEGAWCALWHPQAAEEKRRDAVHLHRAGQVDARGRSCDSGVPRVSAVALVDGGGEPGEREPACELLSYLLIEGSWPTCKVYCI